MDPNSVQNCWSAVTGSVRGASHLRTGAPNQDACASWIDKERGEAILAVSDGHGSLKHFRSQIGAGLAVSTAISVIRETLGAPRDPAGEISHTLTATVPRRLVELWRLSVAQHLEANPFSSLELEALESKEGRATREQVEREPVLAYGATLLAAVSLENCIAFLQLGDGDILVVDEGRCTSRPLPGDERLVGNQTTSLCQPEAWKEFRVGCSCFGADANPPALVLLSTDGYANSFRTEDDFLQIGADYLDMIQELGLEKVNTELPAILTEASAQGSGDDISLGILVGPACRNFSGGGPTVTSQPSRPQPATEAAGAEDQELDPIPGPGTSWRRRFRVASVMPAIALLFVAAVTYSWWSRWPNPQGVPATAPVEGLASSPVVQPKRGAWVLAFDSGDLLWLNPGSTITSKDLKLDSKERAGEEKGASEPTAQVVDKRGAIHLKNVSQASWKVTLPPGKERSIAPGESTPLVEGATIRIGDLRVVVRRLDKLHETSTPEPGNLGDGKPLAPSPLRQPNEPKPEASDADAVGKGADSR